LVTAMGADHFDPESEATPQFGGRLTPRQREVLQLVAEGKSMKEIARILDISVRTVEFHKNGLIQQLGLRTVAELTRYALDQKIAV
jgi:DNA-binding NarL/FixJ family response regulator